MGFDGIVRALRARKTQLIGISAGALLLMGGVAAAVGIGLLNPSFEDGLDQWHAKTLNKNRDVVYSNREGVYSIKGVPLPGCDAPDGYNICVVDGSDEFEVRDSNGTRNVSVSPLDGSKMLRIAGPFGSDNPNQQPHHTFAAEQTFTVDPANPVVTMNYNFFTYDYSGFDELRLVIRLTDEDGDQITRVVQGGFSSGTDLKTTGWVGVPFDLSSYSGQQVNLALELQGTTDHLYGTWGYFDAGQAPAPPVNGAGASGQAPAGVPVNKQVNGSGQISFSMGNTAVAAAAGPSGCIPFTLDLPIEAGTSVLSNVQLRYRSQLVSLTDQGGGVYRGTLQVCPFQDGDLILEYDATEEGQTEHFTVTIGQIVLIDPQGVVYDAQTYKNARAAGQSEAQARSTAAIAGVTARLQREAPAGSGTFVNVLSADPGIDPNVNPQITNGTGLFQWDVSAGDYRVHVSRAGYIARFSREVTIPPPVLDLHIPMIRATCPPQKAALQSKLGVARRAKAAALKARTAVTRKIRRARGAGNTARVRVLTKRKRTLNGKIRRLTVQIGGLQRQIGNLAC